MYTELLLHFLVVDWCIQQKFELVELEYSNLQDTVDYEAERNAYGIERVIEALQAHTWSNMKLKGSEIFLFFSNDFVCKVCSRVINLNLEYI